MEDEYDTEAEKEFLANYDPSEFDRIGVTVDVAVFFREDVTQGGASILLIKRGGHPYKGRWALPGGFVELDEDLDEAASRELAEETGISLSPSELTQLHAYGTPGRDPRMRNVSIVFGVVYPPGRETAREIRAGDDAAEAGLFSWEELFGKDPKVKLAFDHDRVVSDAFGWFGQQVL